MKNQATTHISRTVNGQTLTQSLCSECAAEKGYGKLLNGANLGFGFEDLFGSLFADMKKQTPVREAQRCPGCGSSFSDITSTGKMGCSECYARFFDRLLPTFQRLHGHSRHEGKLPSSANREPDARQQINSLKNSLEQAIAAQEFEQAAQLRDNIRELEQKAGDRK